MASSQFWIVRGLRDVTGMSHSSLNGLNGQTPLSHPRVLLEVEYMKVIDFKNTHFKY